MSVCICPRDKPVVNTKCTAHGVAVDGSPRHFNLRCGPIGEIMPIEAAEDLVRAFGPVTPTATIRCDTCKESTFVVKHVSTMCDGCKKRGHTTWLWAS